MAINDLKSDTTQIKNCIVSYYEGKFGVLLPKEINKIISFESGTFSFNGKIYLLQSFDEWLLYRILGTECPLECRNPVPLRMLLVNIAIVSV